MSDDTRQQLVEMRSRLIGNLGERIGGGDLALLAAVNGALAAIDAADRGLVNAETLLRAIVTDIPGRTDSDGALRRGRPCRSRRAFAGPCSRARQPAD